MSTDRVTRYSEAGYVEIERKSAEKHEFFAGELFPMAGASENHNLIVTNLCRELSQRLKERPCRVYPSDLRVKIPATGLYTYPDTTVACGPREFDDEQADTLLNPTVVCGVLSDSTEKYDRGKKFKHYQSLDSVQAYVLVAQDEASVELFERLDDGVWRLTSARGLEATIDLPTLDCSIPLAEIFDKVEFPPEKPIPGLFSD